MMPSSNSVIYEMEKTMNIEDVPESTRKRAQECKTPEELLALVAEEGYELTDEELHAINGGTLFADCTWDDCTDANCKLCKGLCDRLYH